MSGHVPAFCLLTTDITLYFLFGGSEEHMNTPFFAQATNLERVPLPLIWWLAPLGAVLALGYAWYFYRQVMQESEGNASMIEIAQAVREGAMAYLQRQYRVVGICGPFCGFYDSGIFRIAKPHRAGRFFDRRYFLSVVWLYWDENGHQCFSTGGTGGQ